MLKRTPVRKRSRRHGQHQPRRARGEPDEDPELRHTPSGTAVCKLGSPSTRARRTPRGNWGDKPNYFDVTVWGNQGESCAQYLSKGRPRRRRRPPRLARVGGAGRQRSARRWRSSPTPCSSSAAVKAAGAAAVAASASSSRPARPPATRTSAPHRRTTTFPSDAAARRRQKTRTGSPDASARAQSSGPIRRKSLLLLQGQGRRDRLQEREPAPPLYLGDGEDPFAPYQRRVPAAPAASRGRRQARA